MLLSNKSWRGYIEKLSQINKKSSDLMRVYMSEHPDADVEELIRYAYSIATKYGEAAATLACNMYDAIASASGATVPSAEPARTATFGETAVAVNGSKLQGETLVPGAVERLVKLAGQDTMLNNARRDGAEWAWVPSGDTCAFCITLASRGWQKASRKIKEGNHAQHIHANCDCAFMVRFNDKDGLKGYDPQEYLDQYHEAGGVNGLRRKNYAENKEKINLQKREAYARRKQSSESEE